MTLYLTSAAAVSAVDRAAARGKAAPATAASVGPGKVLSILRAPPEWLRARVDGQVLALTPTIALLGAAYDGRRVAQGEKPSRPHTAPCARRLRLGGDRCTCGAAGLTFAQYRDELLRLWPRGARLAPGVLSFGQELTDQQAERLLAVEDRDGPVAGAPRVVTWDRSRWHGPIGLVNDGDTLVCTCGIGEMCHRMVAAEALHACGWSLIYEGEPYTAEVAAAHEARRLA